jgi:hypothetical protein
MARNRLLMETTKIAADRSASEIVAELVAHGAKSINTDYEAGKIVGLRWVMRVSGTDIIFDMPARVNEVFKLLKAESPSSNLEQLKRKAERVAWRQLLRWVQAQIAMIDCGMAQTAEVFMPFIVMNPAQNQRLFDAMMEQKFKALPEGTR